MDGVGILQANSSLSRLVAAVESRQEKEIIIARNGKPVARLVPLEAARNKVRIGLYDGPFKVVKGQEESDACNEHFARLFGVNER